MRIYSSFLILIIAFFTSCDDGDIIVTTFEFEEQTFDGMCSDQRNKVLYHINNDDVFETLTIAISNSNFSSENNRLLRETQALSLPLDNNTVAPVTIALTGNNEIVYRTYDAAVPNDYFCRDIPPSSPRVIQEYRSVGGEVIINTGVRYTSSNRGMDHDNDGIPSTEEGMNNLQDTDGDGIPDYLDTDDDGDNVLTSIERQVQVEDPTEGEFPDTDDDGTPNYLDPDDDGDGVPTRREITADQQEPNRVQNDAGNMPRYLDRFTTIAYEGPIEFSVVNEIPVSYSSVVEVRNLKLRNQGGDGEEISFTEKGLGIFNSGTVAIPITGNGDGEEDPDEGEENPDEGTEDENEDNNGNGEEG